MNTFLLSASADFKVDSTMHLIAIGVVVFVVAQAAFFLVRAVKHGKELGIDKAKIKNTIISSGVFSIAPALGIVATLVALTKAIGYVLPWIRLSVLGNLTYESTAVETAMDKLGIAGGLATEVTSQHDFAVIAWVMTLGIIFSLVLIPIGLKFIQKKMGKATSGKDTKLINALSAAAFIGLIVAFVAKAIAGTGQADVAGDGAGVMSLIALVSSIVFMLVLEKISTLKKMGWLSSFAMPLAMIGAMAMVIVMNMVLPESIATFEWRY